MEILIEASSDESRMRNRVRSASTLEEMFDDTESGDSNTEEGKQQSHGCFQSGQHGNKPSLIDKNGYQRNASQNDTVPSNDSFTTKRNQATTQFNNDSINDAEGGD